MARCRRWRRAGRRREIGRRHAGDRLGRLGRSFRGFGVAPAVELAGRSARDVASSTSPSVTMTWASALIDATLVPGGAAGGSPPRRGPAHQVDLPRVDDDQLGALAQAPFIRLAKTGWPSVGLAPMTRMTSASRRRSKVLGAGRGAEASSGRSRSANGRRGRRCRRCCCRSRRGSASAPGRSPRWCSATVMPPTDRGRTWPGCAGTRRPRGDRTSQLTSRQGSVIGADHRLGDAVRVGGVAPGEAALDAGMAAIGLAVVPGHHPDDLGRPHLGLEAAADAAVAQVGDDAAIRLAGSMIDFSISVAVGQAWTQAPQETHSDPRESLRPCRRTVAKAKPRRRWSARRCLHLLAGRRSAGRRCIWTDRGEMGWLSSCRAASCECGFAVVAVAHSRRPRRPPCPAIRSRRSPGRSGNQRVIGDIHLHHIAAQALASACRLGPTFMPARPAWCRRRRAARPSISTRQSRQEPNADSGCRWRRAWAPWCRLSSGARITEVPAGTVTVRRRWSSVTVLVDCGRIGGAVIGFLDQSMASSPGSLRAPVLRRGRNRRGSV